MLHSATKRKHDLLENDCSDNDINSNNAIRIGNEDCQHRAGLQHANEDVINIIIDILKLSVKSLVALSLTCSRWYNRIRSAFDKDIQKYYPISYNNYTGQHRLSQLEDFYFLRSDLLDLQHFEFTTGLLNLRIYPVPWAPHIIFLKSDISYGIFNLNKREAILPIPDPTTDCPYRIVPVCTMNKKRKQVVIANTEREEDNMYVDWLNVYNVDDEGTVQFVTKFKSNNSLVDNKEDSCIAPILLDDNGVIWHIVTYFGIIDGTATCRMKKFSIDTEEEIPFKYESKHIIIGMGEKNNKILLFCADPDELIGVFDTSTQRMIGHLPQTSMDANFEVIIMNNFAVYVNQYKSVECVFDLDLFKCLFRLQDEECIILWDERSMILFQLDTSVGRDFAIREAPYINDYLSSTKRDYYSVKKSKKIDDRELPFIGPMDVGPSYTGYVENILFWVTEDRNKGRLKISRLKVNRPVIV